MLNGGRGYVRVSHHPPVACAIDIDVYITISDSLTVPTMPPLSGKSWRSKMFRKRRKIMLNSKSAINYEI